MNDISVEQIIKIKEPKTAVLFKVVLILASFISLTTIPSIFAWGVILCAIFVVLAVLVFRYYNAEYEYTLVENELTIDRIIAKSARRRSGVYTLSKTNMMARVGSQDALRMEYKKLKTASYTSGMNPDKEVVFYTMNQHNEEVRIFLEPNDRMIDAMRQVVPKDAFKI